MLRRSSRKIQLTVAAAALLVVGLAGWTAIGTAQDKKDTPPDHSKHSAHTAPADKDVAAQIADLRAKVAQLEATLSRMSPGKMQSGGMGMGGMSGMKPGGAGAGGMGMGMMDVDAMMGGMGGKKGPGGMAGMNMGGGGMGMMDMDTEMMGMMGMGSMGGSKGMKMKMAAALPGFPGASHVYHIGATGFFLDHPEHITLTTAQQTKLNQLQQKAMTDKASAQRRIEEAEQELWELTGADEPDAAKVEAKVRAIEKLRGDQRLAFIRAVGEAAKVLTDEQRKVLLGTIEPKSAKDPHAGH
jgi:Spy/CpxP family protein refolding chaperone